MNAPIEARTAIHATRRDGVTTSVVLVVISFHAPAATDARW
jgi:hypothetical protein